MCQAPKPKVAFTTLVHNINEFTKFTSTSPLPHDEGIIENSRDVRARREQE
jgi:hypothetical protein